MGQNLIKHKMAEAGKALLAIGNALLFILFIYFINYLVLRNSQDLDVIKTVATVSFILNIVATIFIIAKFYESGNALIYQADSKTTQQEWMEENLNVGIFRNGDSIPEAKTNEEWIKAGENKQPAWCYYDNDPTNGEKYGRLYNWYAVKDPRGLAPAGYKIPSYSDWEELVLKYGGQKFAGQALKNTTGWAEDGNGTNESGFSGLPGGLRNWDGIFDKIEKFGNWWSSSEDVSSTNAWISSLDQKARKVYSHYYHKGVGLSVRCLRDNAMSNSPKNPDFEVQKTPQKPSF